jgi:hypothetical protein
MHVVNTRKIKWFRWIYLYVFIIYCFKNVKNKVLLYDIRYHYLIQSP